MAIKKNEMIFNLSSDFIPTGDQPNAILSLVDGLNQNNNYQTLLGVTGSGKTFTIANVIQKVNRPTLVLSHNKTLAAQLFNEFKNFFPDNLVEYFVSYYDYYQPEAYIPSTGVYIEKDLSINEEIEKYRLRATSSLLSGRKDVIVVASVSCIYGIGNPNDFDNGAIYIKIGGKYGRNEIIKNLIEALYVRTSEDLSLGNFRVRGDILDIFPPYENNIIRINFYGDEVEEIEVINIDNGLAIHSVKEINIFPANIFVSSIEKTNQVIPEIQKDLINQIDFFEDKNLNIEAKRIKERTNFDIEMMREVGYCSGIENYSRYFDKRKAGSRPFCLLDYFPKDYLTIIDESHVAIPQLKAMYAGDRARKGNLVEYGFRLPAALDNRPLKLEEFEEISNQTIYVSATPSDYELQKSKGVVVEQIIRPTGLVDPKIVIRSNKNQIDDLIDEINYRINRNERVLITTLTKKMAEKLSSYFSNLKVNCRYLHSDIDTIDRVEILQNLREGVFDVLIGVNLLREGLDLPEVSLVAIMDADKEGFLRSERSLTQTAGRTARNKNGLVIMYADKITDSMQRTIDKTEKRREKQLRYNKKNNITPVQIIKKKNNSLIKKKTQEREINMNLDNANNMSNKKLNEEIIKTKRKIQKLSKELDFIEAAKLRDYLYQLQNLLLKQD
tara:strand:- start:2989 stop:4995 length:2007 start_codon:yes stop_codon:yes gene_type:complete